MNVEERIVAFEKLGKYLLAIDPNELDLLLEKTRNENAWFTPESVKTALAGVGIFLNRDHLQRWLSPYQQRQGPARKVAVVMAGNIPLVGFHDFLSVLISGHSLMAKTSSKDNVLIRFLAQRLLEIEPRFGPSVNFHEQLKNFDAVIATGSDNSARYFEYYFGKYPHIIRKNRTSVAVLSGKESGEDLHALATDVFTYFGLGCRNVSKVFVPQGYDFSTLIAAWDPFRKVLMHHKYNNNYDYHKSIFLLNKEAFLDSGFILIHESAKLVSPISVLYYQTYTDEGDLALKLTENKDKIQTIVGRIPPAMTHFGQSQMPQLWDYADRVDTMKFLQDLA